MNWALYVVVGAQFREEQKLQQLQIYYEADFHEGRSQKISH